MDERRDGVEHDSAEPRAGAKTKEAGAADREVCGENEEAGIEASDCVQG